MVTAESRSIPAGIVRKETAMKQIVVAIGLALACSIAAQAAVLGEEVTYGERESPLKGYLAYDDGVAGMRPGVLVVHEWWGLNDYARKRARMLAELGYIALAVDMYGDGKTAGHPDDAGKFSGELRKNLPLAQSRFLAALNFLRQQPKVDVEKIAAIGYCFGGGVVLEMARAGIDLDGVASFHGSLDTVNPATHGKVKAKILVLNGAADPFVTQEQIAVFKKEMEAAGVEYRIVNYPGTRHSFTNPEADDFGKKFNLPLAYDQEADRKSWQAMQDFFSEIFK
jgi:dienelactone hydrolase